MRIVLVHPQIPQNTGNIVRTCAVTGSELLLVEPLGFSITDRMLKRAGLDYWEGVTVETTSDLPSLLEKATFPFYFFSSKGKCDYSKAAYEKDAWLIFGAETVGLPDLYWERWPDRFVTIPMKKEARCLNLASSAAVATFEAWRQVGFDSFNES